MSGFTEPAQPHFAQDSDGLRQQAQGFVDDVPQYLVAVSMHEAVPETQVLPESVFDFIGQSGAQSGGNDEVFENAGVGILAFGDGQVADR